MTDATAAWITAGASFIVALTAGGFSWWNVSKTNKNSFDIQDLKGAVDRDLERLRAKLSHGQVVSSTQWNAEFSAYQAIWKAMAVVRAQATKIVFREIEMTAIGIPDSYLSHPDRVNIRRELLSKFTNAAQDLLWAIHDNAPFYPATIRKEANDTHSAAKGLIDKHLTALTSFTKGVDVTKNVDFLSESKTLLLKIVAGSDLVESLIRDRLAAIQVVNSGI
jgi:hypothetical protein